MPKRSSALAVGFLVAAVALGCRGVLGIGDGSSASSDGGSGGDGDANDEGGVISDAGTPDVQLVSEFCKNLLPRANVCDDFDKEPFLKGWDNFFGNPDPAVGGGGTLGPDLTRSSSPPRSVRMTIPQLLPGTNADSFLIRELPEGIANIDLIVDVRIETETFIDGVGHVAVLGMSFNGYSPFVEIRRTKDGAYLRLDDMSESPLIQPFPVGVWKTVELDFKFSADAGTVASFIDGVPAGGGDLATSFYHADVYPRVLVGAGLAQGPIGEYKLNVDNVVIRGTGAFK